MSASPLHPRVGMLATIRNRRGLIVSVEDFGGEHGIERNHLVQVEYTDPDGVPEETVLWEREHGRDLMEPHALPRVAHEAPMAPREFDALVRATRWHAFSPFLRPDDPTQRVDRPLSAPFFGAVQVDDFQLVPVLRALQMPRVSLLIADDVGLGKTIEAGLVLSELLLRRRIRRVLILSPAALRTQWRQEMRDKFSLTFDMVDRNETFALQKRLGFDANPWRTYPRIIASYHYLRQPDVLARFRRTCEPENPSSAPVQLPWDLLIVDEAHNLMPANLGEDSELAKMLRVISPYFEHKLFLTATPHNGHTRCFTGLLEQLDPVRFTQTHELSDAEKRRIDDVLVRRLKRDINTLDLEAGRTPRFAQRYPHPLQLFFGPAETALSSAVAHLRLALKRRCAQETGAGRLAGAFAMEVLVKRLLSSPYTFAESWHRFQQGLAAKDIADAAEVAAAQRSADWGGTRKGSGTFYTRPQLASPTTRRTLQPLLTKPTDDRGPLPAEILQIKVCDPAMGSGSFLISALRTLVEALAQSLERHGRLRDEPTRTIIRLADGNEHTDPREEIIPLPRSHPDFDARLRTRLARHVVEHCIYGVELDPLAVELARMALWIETMDRELPFEFLDHKLRCGNSLIGAWIDHVSDFPALCAEREAGDEEHEGHHFNRGIRSAALSQYRSDRLKPGLRYLIGDLQQTGMYEPLALPELRATHAQALAAFQAIHALPMFDAEARAEKYVELRKNPAVVRLRYALDRWCALWFWPTDRLDIAPDPLSPLTQDDATASEIVRLRDHLRFFHWELEFPDVFTGPTAGFDAIVGNPPWETQKPNSMEFFANIDPLYRTYDKQQALRRRRELYKSDERIELQWLDYVGQFTALSNWFHNVARPFGDAKFTGQGEKLNLMDSGGQWRKSDKLHQTWIEHRKDRPRYSDPEHPYRYQGGSDFNTYKLFLEQARALLRNDGRRGRLGLLVPSGIYTDKATGDLRTLFLQHSNWTHLYALQNERFVFGDIDHRFKVAIVIAEKGGTTDQLATRFRIGPGDSPEAHEIEDDLLDDTRFLPLSRATISQFSPNSGAILETRNARDLVILEKMYVDGVLLGDQTEEGWQIRYSTEFHMTNDSKLFPPRAKWEDEGYRLSEYSVWLKGGWRAPDEQIDLQGIVWAEDKKTVIACEDIESLALPLFQGVMVQSFDFAPKAWESGTGLRAIWQEVPWERKIIGPQFLMGLDSARSRPRMSFAFKPGMRRVARSTDTRTSLAAIIPSMPCGDKVSILDPNRNEVRSAELVAIFGSFSFDWIVRLRSGGTQLDQHSLFELKVPLPGNQALASLCVYLNGAAILFARLWIAVVEDRSLPWRRLWAVTPHERLRIRCILDALVARLYGLSEEDFGWILRDCDHPKNLVCSAMYARRFDPKGFWRVEKEVDPELRHPVLAQVAFRDLQVRGLDAFLVQNDGEGWMLPETLCLADFGLGHDERARVAQPVAATLGPRFLPWQLGQSVEASWEECRRHAEIIARIVPPPPLPLIAAPVPATDASTPTPAASAFPPVQAVLTGTPAPGQGQLFTMPPIKPGKPGKPRKKR